MFRSEFHYTNSCYIHFCTNQLRNPITLLNYVPIINFLKSILTIFIMYDVFELELLIVLVLIVHLRLVVTTVDNSITF